MKDNLNIKIKVYDKQAIEKGAKDHSIYCYNNPNIDKKYIGSLCKFDDVFVKNAVKNKESNVDLKQIEKIPPFILISLTHFYSLPTKEMEKYSEKFKNKKRYFFNGNDFSARKPESYLLKFYFVDKVYDEFIVPCWYNHDPVKEKVEIVFPIKIVK